MKSLSESILSTSNAGIRIKIQNWIDNYCKIFGIDADRMSVTDDNKIALNWYIFYFLRKGLDFPDYIRFISGNTASMSLYFSKDNIEKYGIENLPDGISELIIQDNFLSIKNYNLNLGHILKLKEDSATGGIPQVKNLNVNFNSSKYSKTIAINLPILDTKIDNYLNFIKNTKSNCSRITIISNSQAIDLYTWDTFCTQFKKFIKENKTLIKHSFPKINDISVGISDGHDGLQMSFSIMFSGNKAEFVMSHRLSEQL
jgi:hypothetical protein